jgi:hypothetical protein
LLQLSSSFDTLFIMEGRAFPSDLQDWVNNLPNEDEDNEDANVVELPRAPVEPNFIGNWGGTNVERIIAMRREQWECNQCLLFNNAGRRTCFHCHHTSDFASNAVAVEVPLEGGVAAAAPVFVFEAPRQGAASVSVSEASDTERATSERSRTHPMRLRSHGPVQDVDASSRATSNRPSPGRRASLDPEVDDGKPPAKRRRLN